MATQSVSELVERVKQSGLIASGQFPEIEAAADASRDVTDEFTAKMRDGKLLTDYQIQILVSEDSQPLLIADRYEIRDKLGAGGMGEVFLAHDRQLDRDVAIKVLSPRLVADDDAVARFQREAKAMARLEHPSIVRAYDSGSDGDRHFLVMEFVNGASVDALLTDAGQLEAPIAADYTYQAALGLQHAHKKGLIHRDLKPSNLLVGRDGRIKILDLGLARFLQDQIDDETITVAGTGLGTPDYMAPEQFGNARNADERSDVYALGCTLYRMLTGRVPFPGSSLSQKRQDHQSKPPDPIEESAPSVPAGLAQAVYKMMAKKPGDRFQSARECAEALTPYVAASSASLPKLSGTVEWEGSQLTIVTSTHRRRRTVRWVSIGALTAVIGIATGFGLAQLGGDADTPDEESVAAKTDGTGSGQVKSQSGKTIESMPSRKKPAAIGDAWVLTVAKDGTGRFRTIGEAMTHVQPGMTIRVTDDGIYQEFIRLNRSANHRGITLEATKGATLVPSPGRVNCIEVVGIPDVTIRGFRYRGGQQTNTFMIIKGRCPGMILENVELTATGDRAFGIVHWGDVLNAGTDSIIIRDCIFHGIHRAIDLVGCGQDENYRNPYPCGHSRIERNRFLDCQFGIRLKGAIQKVQVVGNVFVGSSSCGLQFENLFAETKNLVVANNTMFECKAAFRLWDNDVRGDSIQFCNNLILKSGDRDDLVFLDNGGKDAQSPIGPGNGKAVTKRWLFKNNWRELPLGDSKSEEWIPPGSRDKSTTHIKVLSRDPKDKLFAVPEIGSSIAIQGGGRSDPALPSYVGAAPPKGVPAWDWSRTWRAPPGKNSVLTVSKDAKDGGKYRTINAALKDAKPWDTVRVLDDAVYAETLLIDDPKRHTGITVEAPKQATIELNDEVAAVTIEDVPSVVLRGFLFRKTGGVTLTRERPVVAFVEIKSTCPGGRLSELSMKATQDVTGVFLQNVVNPLSDPFTIASCDINVGYYGIIVSSVNRVGRGIRIENNHVRARKGIGLEFSADNVLVAGNDVRNGTFANFELRDSLKSLKHVALFNNTFYRGACSFRVWQELTTHQFNRDQISIQNNVFTNANLADMVVLRQETGTGVRAVSATRASEVWKFGGNFRDLAGKGAQPVFSLNPADRMIPAAPFLSTTAGDADFLRPKANSPLATGGVGGDLPSYSGAVPPKGTQPWDWNVTWRSRMMRAKYVEKRKAKP